MKHPQPDTNTPSPDKLGVFPTLPRFTLETLREIRIATGDGDSTIAAYTYTHGGADVTKYAEFSETIQIIVALNFKMGTGDSYV